MMTAASDRIFRHPSNWRWRIPIGGAVVSAFSLAIIIGPILAGALIPALVLVPFGFSTLTVLAWTASRLAVVIRTTDQCVEATSLLRLTTRLEWQDIVEIQEMKIQTFDEVNLKIRLIGKDRRKIAFTNAISDFDDLRAQITACATNARPGYPHFWERLLLLG